MSPWEVMIVAVPLTMWFVLTGVWMHVFDNKGEPWWAVYVPIYRRVCQLRALEVSPHYIWPILMMYGVGAYLLTQQTPSMPYEQKVALMRLGAVLIVLGPIWVNVQMLRRATQ